MASPSNTISRIECAAVLFDLDGVLVDSTAYIERQWRDWAIEKKLAPGSFVRYCDGRRAVETIRPAAPWLDADAEVAQFREHNVEEEVALAALPGPRRLRAALPGAGWAVVPPGE